jgi:CheY-like chemotaxis protein
MGSHERPKILCVEDHADTCEMISHLLPEFEIITAATKNEAVQMVRDGGFSLILMDYHLPDGTGEEACHIIRHFDQKTPILFVTGSITLTNTKAVSLGAQGVLKKGSLTFVEELQARAAELALVQPKLLRETPTSI